MDTPNMSGICLVVLIKFFAHERTRENLLRKERTR
jgi:hypothetical protein